MILYHNAFGSLAGIILIGDQCVPWVYLLFLAVILDLASRWPPPSPTNKNRNIISTQKWIRRRKISGIRGIILVSVSHWSKSRNSTNPICYFGGHLGFGIKMTTKHDSKTRNGFFALKLVGLEVLLWYLCYICQNLGIPQIQYVILAAIFDLASRWSPKHNFNTRNGFFGLKLVGLEVLL